MGTPLPHSHFTTQDIQPDQRFQAWREHLSAVFDPSLPSTTDPDGFGAAVSGYLFGPISQMHCRTKAQHINRSTRKIDADGVDNYMVQVFRRGGCIANIERGEVTMNAGDICVFDNAQTLDSYNSDFDLLALFVPRNLLAPHLTTPDNHHLACIKSHQPLAILLRQHLSTLQKNAASMTLEEGDLLVAPTLSLLAATLNGSPAANEGGEQAVRLAIVTRIKSFIDDNITNPRLNADYLSDAFGVSRTRLYKMFATTDGVASYIRHRRLSASLSALTDPKQAHRKIIDIALSLGFGSEVSFIRAFRRRYGMTPSDARHQLSDTSRSALYDFSGSEWRNWMRVG